MRRWTSGWAFMNERNSPVQTKMGISMQEQCTIFKKLDCSTSLKNGRVQIKWLIFITLQDEIRRAESGRKIVLSLYALALFKLL